MNEYVTGATIKSLRESKGMTQTQLADKIFVTAKAVSKWETGHGLPDISL
ncbi:MAG: helix-turn-helix transcriptional regulator, partial [Treponema sp.]|nr:helix-turn-helix transcriptional regulator [Treponema sp.]